MESIADIKQKLSLVPIEDLPQAVIPYIDDSRSGVKKVVEYCRKKYEAYQNEIERLKSISQYENSCFDNGMQYIAGIDEVGRGPLAGPVVTAAVILPKGCLIHGINDSKKLSPKKREYLYSVIMENALAVRGRP